jgi:hypothetical protein
MCDAPFARREVRLNDALRRLCEFRSENGNLLIVLASSRSRSYEFKKMALSRLFGGEWLDLTAEDLRFVETISSAKYETVDGAFILDNLLQIWEEQRGEGILKWLRYFLRTPLQPGEDIAEEIVDLLTSFVQSRESLSEDLLGTKEGIRSYPAGDRVLLHKTHVWIA